MLRLKTTKTKFCQLVADMAAALDWVKMPNRESIHFWKVYRQSDYFLSSVFSSLSWPRHTVHRTVRLRPSAIAPAGIQPDTRRNENARYD